MNTQPFKNDSYSHAPFLVDTERETLQHDQWQEIPLAIANHLGQNIKALTLGDVTSLTVNPKYSEYFYHDMIKGRYWVLVTSDPVEDRKVPQILNWLLRNYNVTPRE